MRARWPHPVLFLYIAILLLMGGLCHAAPSGPESDSCSTLVQSRFFGFFLSSSVFPTVPCSWTLQNPDPRRYTIFIKVTKPTENCIPQQLRTFQYDSFLETTRTYLGMESFDEVVRLCDTSAPVAFLEAGKQFLQMRKGHAKAGMVITDGNGDFKTEYLVVGKRNPSMAACQMLCQWLEDCLTSSTSNTPCGIMQTPCLCWDQPPLLSDGESCSHNGVYLQNCLPSITTSVCVSLGGWSVWGQWAQCSSECGGGIQTRTRTCQSPPEESYLCEGVLEEGRPCNNSAVCPGKTPPHPTPAAFLRSYCAFFVLFSCCCGLPQWTVSGMSGPAGALALPPALMEPCREPGSATAPHMEALSAEASGWRLSTASLESVQVREPGAYFEEKMVT
uniref:Adhesion G protein-coupled receptor B N-terminal domain-containing protein n=1 Tax=Amphilophus citrinellus TaxID=61819 RepID=A0A3Q0S1L9_AMPCI